MFRASEGVASLALRCLAPGHSPPVVTSRRYLTSEQAPEDNLDLVGEAVGERLVRLASGMAGRAALSKNPPERILVLRDPEHFAEDLEKELAGRLGLSVQAKEFRDFRAALAGEFRDWLVENPEVREQMRGEFDNARFFIRCPPIRRRRTSR